MPALTRRSRPWLCGCSAYRAGGWSVRRSVDPRKRSPTPVLLSTPSPYTLLQKSETSKGVPKLPYPWTSDYVAPGAEKKARITVEGPTNPCSVDATSEGPAATTTAECVRAVELVDVAQICGAGVELRAMAVSSSPPRSGGVAEG